MYYSSIQSHKFGWFVRFAPSAYGTFGTHIRISILRFTVIKIDGARSNAQTLPSIDLNYFVINPCRIGWSTFFVTVGNTRPFSHTHTQAHGGRDREMSVPHFACSSSLAVPSLLRIAMKQCKHTIKQTHTNTRRDTFVHISCCDAPIRFQTVCWSHRLHCHISRQHRSCWTAISK